MSSISYLRRVNQLGEALSVSAGIRFDKIQPLLLPLVNLTFVWQSVSERGREAKNGKIWFYQLILQGIDVDMNEVALELEKLASDMRKAGEIAQDSRNEPE